MKVLNSIECMQVSGGAKSAINVDNILTVMVRTMQCGIDPFSGKDANGGDGGASDAFRAYCKKNNMDDVFIAHCFAMKAYKYY